VSESWKPGFAAVLVLLMGTPCRENPIVPLYNCNVPEKSPVLWFDLVIDEYEATWLLVYFREENAWGKPVLFGA
jgi:hypothetical protein